MALIWIGVGVGVTDFGNGTQKFGRQAELVKRHLDSVHSASPA